MKLNIVFDHFDGEKPLPNGLFKKYHKDFWDNDHNHYNVLTRFIPINETRLGFFHILLENSKIESNIIRNDQINPNEINIYPIELNYSDRSLILENCFSQISEKTLEAIRKGQVKLLVYYAFEAFSVNQANWINLVERSLGTLNIPAENVIFVFGCENLFHNLKTYYDEFSPFWNWRSYNWLYFSHFEFEFSHYLNFIKGKPEIHPKELVENLNVNKNPSKKYLCLNGGGREHRVFFLKELYRRKLDQYGHISYLNKFLGGDNTSEFVDIFDPSHLNVLDFHKKFQLEKIFLDTPEAYDEWHNRGMSRWTYEDTWFSVVTETLYRPDSTFLTEKSFKPIANLHPFLILGYPGLLKSLKQLGYQTFSDWFDESYDNEYSNPVRFKKILNETKRLSQISNKEWQKMLKEMQPTLEYNRKLLFSKQFGQQIDTLMEQIISVCQKPNESMEDLRKYLSVPTLERDLDSSDSYLRFNGRLSSTLRRLDSLREKLLNKRVFP